jgi:hypothetical protein
MSSPMPKQDLPPTPEPPPIHETKSAPKSRQIFVVEIQRHLVRKYPVISIIKHATQKDPQKKTPETKYDRKPTKKSKYDFFFSSEETLIGLTPKGHSRFLQ